MGNSNVASAQKPGKYGHGVRLQGMDGLADAVRAALAADRPTVIEVVVPA